LKDGALAGVLKDGGSAPKPPLKAAPKALVAFGGAAAAPGTLRTDGVYALPRRARRDMAVLKDGALAGALKDGGSAPKPPLKRGAALRGLGELEDRPGSFMRRARRDALPEHTPYADTGCEVHHSCLSCPLVRCRYDEPGGARRLLSQGRDRQIAALQRAGEGISEIARQFGVSRRTVFRALARGRSLA